MKNALLIAFSCIVIQAQAQHIDISIGGGMLTTLQTNQLFQNTYYNKSGNGFSANTALCYAFKNGILFGIDATCGKMQTKAGFSVYNYAVMFEPYNPNYKLIWGAPATMVDALFGYRLKLQKSTITLNVKAGYIFTGCLITKGDPKYINAYMGDNRGYNYGVDAAYQYDIGKHIAAGIKLSPTVVAFNMLRKPHFLCLNSIIAIHYYL